MAASEESCDGNPDFAVICSFIVKFGYDCGVNVTIPCLQQMLEDTKNVHEDLAELHIHLLRRGRKRVTKERWEKCLIKFCHEYSSVDAWELERFGYKKAKLSVKLEILKRLLELQFDANVKFKTEVNKQDAHSLRIAPIGRDINGQMYWYQLDKDYNMRLYRQGVADDNTWQLLCSSTDHLRNLLSSLEKNITNTTGLDSEGVVKDGEEKKEDIDSAVPKMETDGEDLTSCISQTNPCAIIIKSEKRENISSGKLPNTAKAPIKDEVNAIESDVSAIENDKVTVAENTTDESKENKNECADNPGKSSGGVIKKEVSVEEETSKIQNDTSPMEIDDTKKEKDKHSNLSKVNSKNDIEMISVESTPVADKVPPSLEVLDVSKDIATVTTPDATKISSIEDAPETKFKGSKIKLYEKWSQEKKQVTSEAVKESEQNLSATNLKETVDSKESLPEDLTISHKASSESALTKSKSFNISPSKPLNEGVTRVDEVPMDLSVSCRANEVDANLPTDLATSLSKKRPLSDLDATNLNYNGGNVRSSFSTNDSYKTTDVKYPNNSEAPRPFKKKHLSVSKEEPMKDSNDHSRKSVIFEVKSSKLLNQFQESKSSNDSVSDRTSNSGFSHLQALQNMCNENPMTCFQSNIHSSSQDKRSSFESCFVKYGVGSAEKSSLIEAACDTLSKKYTFSNTQLSGDLKHAAEKTDPPPLLKSNVHTSGEASFKENVHLKPDVSSAPKEIHGHKLAAKIDQLVQQNKDFSNEVGKCVKSSNQNIPSGLEKDNCEVKDFCLTDKTKKELNEKSCRIEPVSLSKIDQIISPKKTEKLVSESKVKHTISSMLNTDIVSSKSDNLNSCSSSFISKPSDVPAIITSNHTEKTVPTKCSTPDFDRETLSKPFEKNSEIIKPPKVELIKDNVAVVQDTVSEHCVKHETSKPLISKKSDSSEISQCLLISKNCPASLKSEGIDTKSVSIAVSKHSEVPLSSHESLNLSKVVEQETTLNKFQLGNDPNSSLDEQNKTSLSQKTEGSVFIEKNSSHINKDPNEPKVITNPQQENKEIASTYCDIVVGNTSLNKPSESGQGLTTLKEEPELKSSNIDTSKKKISEISEIAEHSPIMTADSKSITSSSLIKKCDVISSVDNVRIEESSKTTELINEQNCESALGTQVVPSETAANVKQEQNSNDHFKQSAAVSSEGSKLHFDKLQNDKTDMKSVTDKSVSHSSVPITDCDIEHFQTELKSEISKPDHQSSCKKSVVSENKIVVEKPKTSIQDKNSLENHETIKFENQDTSEIKQTTSDQNVELSQNATVDQLSKKGVKKEPLPEKKDSLDQKNNAVTESCDINLIPSVKIDLVVKSEDSKSEKPNSQIDCDSQDSSCEKSNSSAVEQPINSKEQIPQKCETNTESSDKILSNTEKKVNVSILETITNQSERKRMEVTNQELSDPSKNNAASSLETAVTSSEEKSCDHQSEIENVKKRKAEVASLSSGEDSQLQLLTTESEKTENEKFSICNTVVDKLKDKSEDSSDAKTCSSRSISIVPSKTGNTEASQLNATEIKLQSSVSKESSVMSEARKDSSDLKNSENKITKNLEPDIDNSETKTLSTEISKNKASSNETHSIKTSSVNEFQGEMDSKSFTNVNSPGEKSVQDKEKICLQPKNDVSIELECKESVTKEISSKQLKKDNASKVQISEISSGIETTSDQLKETDDESKSKMKKHEINSKSLNKETSKTQATSPKQETEVCSSNNSLTKLESESVQPKDIPAKEPLKFSSVTESVDTKNNSKVKEVPKSEQNEKIEKANDKNTDIAVSNIQQKKSKKTSSRASRSSRKKYLSSRSTHKIEENKSSDNLLAKSEPVNSLKSESTKCETPIKEVEQIKIMKNDKHIPSSDVKTECDVTSVKKKETSKKIKKESLEMSEQQNLSGQETKCDLNLCKLDIQNPLNLYLVMNCRCLETKVRHPQCGKLDKKPCLTSAPSKPKLITTFSLDTNDDVEIISSVCSPNLGKKKRGRLRQRGSTSKSPAPLPPPPPVKSPPEPVKSPVKVSRQRASRNSKKPAATSGKDNFTIPEGFLEILSNTQADTVKAEPRRKSKGKKAKISTPSAQSSESESAPIKRSRRIQEQHQKKMSELAVEMEREQRMLEQLAKKTAKKPAIPKLPVKVQGTKTPRTAKTKFQPPTPEDTCLESKRTTRKMNSRSRNMTKMTLMYEDESKDSEFSTSRETEKSKKRRRGKGARKGYKPWDLSSESSSSVEEITEEEEEEPEEPLIFEVNEDEFACEEVDEDAEPIVVRRARTAKKASEDTTTEENVVVDDKPCSKCGKYDKPEWILLCDKCDNGYHTTCLIPPLIIIPEGDWYCQPCEHMFLCELLQKELHDLELILKQREREELRKQRLAYVGISLDNVLKPEKKEKSDESSKEEEEEEEDEEEEANEVEHKRRKNKESSDDERHRKLYGKRSVRARRNVNYQFKEYDALIASAIQEEMLDKLTEDEEDFKEKEKSEDSDKPFTAKLPRKKGGRRKRASRLNDLDFSDEDEDSGEEYKGSSSDSEQTAPPSRSGTDAESAASGEWRIVKTKAKSARKPRQKRKDSSDEEWDENESDSYRPTTRRAAQKTVSYKELSSDEDDEWNPKPKAAPKKRKKFTSSEDSEASYKKKKPKRKSRVRKWASSSSEEESEQSMSFSGSSQGSEDEWKVKKSSEGNKIKININKKVLSSDENDDSQESAPKKRPNKVVSDPESDDEEEEEEEEEEDEEEEESSEEEDEEEEDEEEDDEEEGEEENTKIKHTKDVPLSQAKDLPTKPKNIPSKPKDTLSKPNDASSKPKDAHPKLNDVQPKLKDVPFKPKATPSITDVEPKINDVPQKVVIKSAVIEKEPAKVDVPKAVETVSVIKKEASLPVVEPFKERVLTTPVKDKQTPQRTVKKDATKMVPCVIPYDKSPKSGYGATADEESDKGKRNKMDTVGVAKQFPFPKTGTTSNIVRAPSSSKHFTSTIIQPFSNIDDENDSDDEVPLERIPTAAPTSIPPKPLSYTRDSEYTPAKELSGFSYTTPEEKCFPPTYSSLASFQDYSSRPSPLKPSLVETYSNNSSPSKLTPLDSYSNTNSPKGFISLDSYSDSRKKKQHFYGTPEPETMPRPVPPDSYQGEIRFPPSPSTYAQRSPPHVARDAGTPPRFHSQYPDTYAAPRSPEYYQNQPYYPGEERIPRSTYQPNYVPPEPVPPFVPNPYVATPAMQPNGGFMIDTLLRARNPENEEDELTGVTDIVSYITQE